MPSPEANAVNTVRASSSIRWQSDNGDGNTKPLKAATFALADDTSLSFVAVRRDYNGSTKGNVLVLTTGEGKQPGPRTLRLLKTCTECILVETVTPRKGDICNRKVQALKGTGVASEAGHLKVVCTKVLRVERFASL